MPPGAPGANYYHSPGSFPPAINGGPPPPTSSPGQPLQPPGQQQRGAPSQYMNGSMGPPPASGRGPMGGPPQPHMPTQHGSIPPQPGNMSAAHAHMPPPTGMPPSVGGMPQSGAMPPQHGGSSFQPFMQPGPPTGKLYHPSPVSEYLTCHRNFMSFVPVLSLAHGI